jgi:uncharacterized protein
VRDLDVRALVLAKAPVAGRVKTRLCPPYTATQAATLAAAALADTIDAVARSAATHRVLVLDGSPDLVATVGFDIIAQRGDGLDERIAAAFASHPFGPPLPQLLVGMDTPQLTADLLDDAMTALLSRSTDAVIGPADDGGYWAVGLRSPDTAAFLGVPMSRPWTYLAQRAQFDRLGLRVVTLPMLRDVDDAADAREVADIAPSSAFAEALRNTDDEMAASC